jgi:hypothetical protein
MRMVALARRRGVFEVKVFFGVMGYFGTAGLAMVGCFVVAGPEIILTVRGRLVFRIGN